MCDHIEDCDGYKPSCAQIETSNDPGFPLCFDNNFERWLRAICFQQPTMEAYALSKKAWAAATVEELTPPPQPPQAEGESLPSNKHPDLIEWEKIHKCPLVIGSKISIKPTAEYYDKEYDEGKVYMVTLMYVDSGGLNLGINDGEGDRYSCETDGYYIADVEPATTV